MTQYRTTIQRIQFFFACIFFASIPYENFSPFMENLSVAKIAFIPYMASLFTSPKDLFSRRDIKFSVNCVLFVFSMFVLSSIANMNNGIFNTSIFFNILMFWMLLNQYRRDTRLFSEGLIWYAISIFSIAVFSMMGIGVGIGVDGRVSVFDNNANELGIKAGAGFFIVLCYCLANTRDRAIYRPYMLLLLLPLLFLLLGSGSRTAVVFLVLGVAFFVYFKPSHGKYDKYIWLIIGFVCCIIGWQYLLTQDTLVDRFTKTIEEGDLSARDEIWGRYVERIEESPIIGYGFDGTTVNGRHSSPHNVFIEILLFSGILGLIPFLIFLYDGCKSAWLYLKKRDVILPCILMVACFGMLISQQALGVKSFWLIMAFAISYNIRIVNR